MPDIPPVSLGYAGFDGTTTGITWSSVTAAYKTGRLAGKQGLDLSASALVAGNAETATLFGMYRGTISFWMRLDSLVTAPNGLPLSFYPYPQVLLTYNAFTATVASASGTSLVLTSNPGLFDGLYVHDVTTPAAVPSATTISSINGNTLTLNHSVTASPGDTIFFGGQIQITVIFDGSIGGGGSVQVTWTSGIFDIGDGNFHNVVWAWVGTDHKLYLDNVLAAGSEITALSHFDAAIGAATTLSIDSNIMAPPTITMTELGFYNWAFNTTDVNAAFTASTLAAVSASGTYGLSVVPLWAPGIGQVQIMADAGNEYAVRADHVDVTVKNGGTTIATQTLTGFIGGFVQGFIPATFVAGGSYTAQVVLKDSGGTVLDTVTTAAYSVPSAATWIGNSLGIPPAGSVQPPFTAVGVSGKKLSVWGRTYDLTGGWGLPQQITSQGQNLLSQAIDIDFNIGSGNFNLTPGTLTITSAASDVVTWTGTASGGGIDATINGTLTYDGMVTIALMLAPHSGSVSVTSINLQTRMPPSRALFYSWQGEGSNEILTYDPGVATAVAAWNSGTSYQRGQIVTYGGQDYSSINTSNLNNQPDISPAWWVPLGANNIVWTNLGHYNAMKQLVESVALVDDVRGLEWFGDNMQGWSVDLTDQQTSTPVQQIINDGTDVRLQISFSTVPFTLSAARTISFGYHAAPVKPVAVNWRGSQLWGVAGGGPAVVVPTAVAFEDKSALFFYHLENQAGFPLWREYGYQAGDYTTISADTAEVASNAASLRATGVKFCPYQQLHTVIGPYSAADGGPGDTPPNDTDTVLGFLENEACSSDGDTIFGNFVSIRNNSIPTKGMGDYILHCWDSNLTAGAADVIYLDEADAGKTSSAGLISGAGWIDSGGLLSRMGYLSQGARTTMKRLRQLHIDHGASGTGHQVWVDGSMGGFSPHTWAFVDAIWDGEGITIMPGLTTDWIAKYNTTVGVNWLRGLTNGVKWGWVGAFLDQYKGSDVPTYRSGYGFLTLFDIVPSATYNPPWPTFMQARLNFGINNGDVVFWPYWTNAAIVDPSNTLTCSYYTTAGKALAYIVNTTTSSATKTMTFNPGALGLVSGTVTAKDGEVGSSITVTGGTFPVTVGAHDYIAVELDGTPVPSTLSPFGLVSSEW